MTSLLIIKTNLNIKQQVKYNDLYLLEKHIFTKRCTHIVYSTFLISLATVPYSSALVPLSLCLLPRAIGLVFLKDSWRIVRLRIAQDPTKTFRNTPYLTRVANGSQYIIILKSLRCIKSKSALQIINYLLSLLWVSIPRPPDVKGVVLTTTTFFLTWAIISRFSTSLHSSLFLFKTTDSGLSFYSQFVAFLIFLFYYWSSPVLPLFFLVLLALSWTDSTISACLQYAANTFGAFARLSKSCHVLSATG